MLLASFHRAMWYNGLGGLLAPRLHYCKEYDTLYVSPYGAIHILYNAQQGEGGWQFVMCVIWREGVVSTNVI